MEHPTRIRLWLVSSVASTISLIILGTALLFNPTFNSIGNLLLVVVLSIVFSVSWKQYFKYLGVSK